MTVKDQNETNIVFITDNEYAIPTGVAIFSLIQNKNKDSIYQVHVFCHRVNPEHVRLFENMSRPGAMVSVRQLDDKFTNWGVQHQYVSTTALHKFDLPNLLPQYDKVLYLDGDILVQRDLSELYNTQIDGFYIAAVKDMVGEKALGLNDLAGVVKYFNSGVMLMNIKKMREDAIPNKLFAVRKQRSDFLTMDQDVLNNVFDGNVLWLNSRFNVMAYNLVKVGYPVAEINEFYGTKYQTLADMLADAAIVHLTNNKKPWLDKFSFLNLEWFKYFKQSGFADIGKVSDNETTYYEFEVRNMQDQLALSSAQESSLSLENKLSELRGESNSTRLDLATAKNQRDRYEQDLLQIYNSRTWKMAVIVSQWARFLMPNKYVRVSLASALWRVYKFVKRIPNKMKALLVPNAIRKGPKPARVINQNSKKIVYVGHYFHDKTKLTEFLIDMLHGSFQVEVVLDESYIGKPFPDLSFVDDSYLGVVFFQSLPPKHILEQIKNDNIIYFPMYDNIATADFGYWEALKNLKVVSFSKTLHAKLKKWGLDSMHIQYFPKPGEFSPGEASEVFFWQRLTRININTIKGIFGQANVSIHIHKAVDPYQEFVQPKQDDESKYGITYSDWFENKDELEHIIKEKGIFVAPREFEGIGMSFLEAMAMGKAVVAVDNPTMNEYIENGRTGYLFNLKNPKPIDFSKIKEVQKNAHVYMKAGHERWVAECGKIIDFIKKV